ncbi:hypothetical protein [Plantactinospora sp. BB1]|uniref:hypothetical protein n=1 Tax=Plantactinospora sp. BB1 TaxID=2071627 RepID=UPI000D17875B|nr:hypothetical protein [Plantactinospora sp. BB1]AVT39627.1 hypothetical protein C6W10_27885 [Plantactinospora sp. BB1]
MLHEAPGIRGKLDVSLVDWIQLIEPQPGASRSAALPGTVWAVTDEAAADEPGDKTEPTGPRSIRYRGADGEWHQIAAEPKRTGDPELDAIWAMSLDEVERIIEDESHPLHEKAKQVSAEVGRPIAEALADILRPVTESIMPRIDTSWMVKGLAPRFGSMSLFPAVDTSSWLARLAPEVPKFELPGHLARHSTTAADIESPPAQPTREQHWIDFDAIEPPVASLAEIHEAAEARAHELRSKQIEILTDLLRESRASAESGQEALDISKQSLAATKSSKRAGWIAAWAAIIAALISVAGILVTVLVSE